MYITRVHLAFYIVYPVLCVCVACVADRWRHGGDGVMATGPPIREGDGPAQRGGKGDGGARAAATAGRECGGGGMSPSGLFHFHFFFYFPDLLCICLNDFLIQI